MNMGGRAYPVRHYPIAIRLRDLAFGNMVAMIVDTVNIRATCASALPTHSRSSWGPHNILSHSMYCAISSEWGLFGRNTRSAFRRTPSLHDSSNCTTIAICVCCTNGYCLFSGRRLQHPKNQQIFRGTRTAPTVECLVTRVTKSPERVGAIASICPWRQCSSALVESEHRTFEGQWTPYPNMDTSPRTNRTPSPRG